MVDPTFHVSLNVLSWCVCVTGRGPTYFGGRDLKQRSQLFEADVVVQFAGGQQVVLDNRAVQNGGPCEETTTPISQVTCTCKTSGTLSFLNARLTVQVKAEGTVLVFVGGPHFYTQKVWKT